MSNHQNEPYVIIVVHTPEQLLLVIEKEVIAEINDVEEVFTLLSSFFVFNLCYPVGCTNFYLFC